jgi:hypothetical protein
VPDWLNVDLFQTILLLAATALAFKTFLAEQDAREDAAVERRLELVITRISELGAVAAESREKPGQGPAITAALRNLRSALAVSPAELPKAKALSTWTTDVAFQDEKIDEALQEVEDALRKLTAGERPQWRLRRGRKRS